MLRLAALFNNYTAYKLRKSILYVRPRIHGQCIIKFQKYFLSVYFPANQVSGTEMSKWLNELCPIILDMLQDASLIAKREVTTPVRR